MANEWVLVKDGDNGEVKEPGQAMLARIAAHDPLFDRLYGEVRTWPLPNGDTVRLYRRTVGPRQPHEYPVVLIETSKIADAINQWWSPEATLVFSTLDTAAWIGLHDLRADRVVVAGAEETQPADYLDGLTGTLLVATRYDRPGAGLPARHQLLCCRRRRRRISPGGGRASPRGPGTAGAADELGRGPDYGVAHAAGGAGRRSPAVGTGHFGAE